MTAPGLDLEALREVVANGTPGKWYVNSGLLWGADNAVVSDVRHLTVPNAALIVAAVNALPVLLDALEEARGERSTAAMQMAQAFRERDAALSSGDRARRAMNEAKDRATALTADRDGLRDELKRTRHALGDAEFNANEGWKWHKHAAELCKKAEAEVARLTKLTADQSEALRMEAQNATDAECDRDTTEAEVELLKDQKAGLISDSLELTRKIDAARAEVARLTAVVQGVREIADRCDEKPAADYIGPIIAKQLRAVLAGGTDTPKACCTCPPDCGPDDCVTANCGSCLHGCPAPEECCADTEGDA